MFPCRYGRRNVVNLVLLSERALFSPWFARRVGFGVGFVGSDSGCGRVRVCWVVVGCGDKPSAY